MRRSTAPSSAEGALLFLLSVGIRFVEPVRRLALSSERAFPVVRPMENIALLASLMMLVGWMVRHLL